MAAKSKTLASFQLLDSPYNGKTAALVLTAPSETNLKNAVRSLFLSSEIGTLSGDGTLMETDGTLHSYRFKKAASSGVSFWNGKLTNLDVRFFLLAAGSAAALIVALILFERRKTRRLAVQFRQIDKRFDKWKKKK